MENKNTIGHLTAFFTVFIWGTTFISTKVLLSAFNPLEILFYRFVIALLILTAIYPHRLIIREKKRELLFAGAGLCGVTLYYLFENIALTYTMTSNVSVIVSTAPLFTAGFSHVFFKNKGKIHITFFIGCIMSIMGICFISFSGDKPELNPLGDLLALLAGAIWAMYSIITKKISDYGYNTIQVTRRIFIYGLLFMLPLLPCLDFNLDLSYFNNKVYLVNILFLGILASGICFVTWNCAVKILGPVKTSVYIYLQPVITILVSFFVLGERLTVMSVIGTLLTLSGLVLSENKVHR